MRKLMLLAGVLTAAFVAASLTVEASEANRQLRFVGAVNNGGNGQLVIFNGSDPRVVHNLTSIGLPAGEPVVGLDVRPDTGFLYAKTQKCAGPCSSQLYIVQLNLRAGTATFSPVGAPFETVGRSFGFDFNPTVDRVRVISESDENRRIHPDLGAATVDLTLKYAVGDANEGKDPEAVGAAYIPAPFGGTTTLFDIDSKQDVLVKQTPANDGTLLTVGSLGLDATSAVGFDIVNTKDGPVGMAAIQRVGSAQSRLYRIDLATGNAKGLGVIGGPLAIQALAALDG